MADLLLTSDVLAILLVSLAVGVVVGLTGMGGGALMTPALVFLGIPPAAAVANDLVAAAFTKSVGAAVHSRRGSPDLRLAGLLVTASVPAALIGAWLVGRLGSGEQAQELLRLAIGATLLLTAATYTLRVYGSAFHGWGEGTDRGRPVRVGPTLAVGVIGGFLVGLTSVGSGSIIMISLLLLNPGMSARRLVGTDLVQAVPLVIAAAVGHVLVTGVDWSVIAPLVLGGAPGTFIGARLSARVPSRAVRSRRHHRPDPHRAESVAGAPAGRRCDRGRPPRPRPARLGAGAARPRSHRAPGGPTRTRRERIPP